MGVIHFNKNFKAVLKSEPPLYQTRIAVLPLLLLLKEIKIIVNIFWMANITYYLYSPLHPFFICRK